MILTRSAVNFRVCTFSAPRFTSNQRAAIRSDIAPPTTSHRSHFPSCSRTPHVPFRQITSRSAFAQPFNTFSHPRPFASLPSSRLPTLPSFSTFITTQLTAPPPPRCRSTAQEGRGAAAAGAGEQHRQGGGRGYAAPNRIAVGAPGVTGGGGEAATGADTGAGRRWGQHRRAVKRAALTPPCTE